MHLATDRRETEILFSSTAIDVSINKRFSCSHAMSAWCMCSSFAQRICGPRHVVWVGSARGYWNIRVGKAGGVGGAIAHCSRRASSARVHAVRVCRPAMVSLSPHTRAHTHEDMNKCTHAHACTQEHTYITSKCPSIHPTWIRFKCTHAPPSPPIHKIHIPGTGQHSCR